METHMLYQYSDGVEEKHMIDESLQILEDFTKEVDDKGHEMLNKMAEKDLRETLHEYHHFHGKHGSHHMLEKIAKKLNKVGEKYDEHEHVVVNGERSVDGDVLQENKLERFKVKNVNAIGAGIVKEEEE